MWRVPLECSMNLSTSSLSPPCSSLLQLILGLRSPVAIQWSQRLSLTYAVVFFGRTRKVGYAQHGWEKHCHLSHLFMLLPVQKFTITHLYTWVERGTVRVKTTQCPQPGLKSILHDPEMSTLTTRSPCLSPTCWVNKYYKWKLSKLHMMATVTRNIYGDVTMRIAQPTQFEYWKGLSIERQKDSHNSSSLNWLFLVKYQHCHKLCNYDVTMRAMYF